MTHRWQTFTSDSMNQATPVKDFKDSALRNSAYSAVNASSEGGV